MAKTAINETKATPATPAKTATTATPATPAKPAASFSNAPSPTGTEYRVLETLVKTAPKVITKVVDGVTKTNVNAKVIGYKIGRFVDGKLGASKVTTVEGAVAVCMHKDASGGTGRIANAKVSFAGAAGKPCLTRAPGCPSLKHTSYIKVIFDENGEILPEYKECFKDIKKPGNRRGTGAASKTSEATQKRLEALKAKLGDTKLNF